MQNDSIVIETIQAMHSQENTGYVTGDYLNLYSPGLVAVNVDCRTKMAQWCYSVRTNTSIYILEYIRLDLTRNIN